jgi:putative oxidoreductase
MVLMLLFLLLLYGYYFGRGISMNKVWYYLTAQVSFGALQYIMCFMRIGIGMLTIGHGLLKLLGGSATWYVVGTAMNNLGIYVVPVMWGFIASCTEFFGGIALVLGLGTRIASLVLTFMMGVAFLMHIHNGDPYTMYSFPLSVGIIFISFFCSGAGYWSIDYYLHTKRNDISSY